MKEFGADNEVGSIGTTHETVAFITEADKTTNFGVNVRAMTYTAPSPYATA